LLIDRFVSGGLYKLSSAWDKRAEELERQEEEEEYNRSPAKPYIEAWEEENNRKTTLNGIYNELYGQSGFGSNSVADYMSGGYGNNNYGGYDNSYGNYGYYDQ